jgi:hypothetical protein
MDKKLTRLACNQWVILEEVLDAIGELRAGQGLRTVRGLPFGTGGGSAGEKSETTKDGNQRP